MLSVHATVQISFSNVIVNYQLLNSGLRSVRHTSNQAEISVSQYFCWFTDSENKFQTLARSVLVNPLGAPLTVPHTKRLV